MYGQDGQEEQYPFLHTNLELREEADSQWMHVWERIDKRRSERIPLKDMEYFLLHSKYADDLPNENIKNLLDEADKNMDGYLSKSEFIAMMEQTKRSPLFRRIVQNSCYLTIPRSSRTAEVRRYVDAFSCLPPPLFMILITIAEIAVFVYSAYKVGEPITASGPIALDSIFIYNPQKRNEAWRYISYILIHAGWVHLVNNLFLQLVLGVVLELVHHWWRIMIIYLVGAIGGCLASSLTNPTFYLAGASGGVYAIEYAYIGNLILNWSEMKYPIVQAVALSLISSLDIGYAIWDTYFNGIPSATSYMAHLGGAVTGVLIGVNVLRNLKKEPWEKYCWWICFSMLVALFTAAILVHVFATSYFPVSDRI